MDQRILEFIGDLRRAELRISPSEALDALAASTEIGLETARRSRPRSPPRSSRSRATSRPSTGSSTSTSSTSRPSAGAQEGPRPGGSEDPGDARPARLRDGHGDGRADRAHAPRRGQRHGDGHPPGRPERRPRAADVLPPDRLLLAPHLRQVRLGGDRARPLPHHADPGGQGAGPGHARAHPQLPRPAPRGLPPDDPPARGARAGAPRLPRGGAAHARGPDATSRSSPSRPTRSPR